MTQILEYRTELGETRGSRLRWWICGWLFAATVVNYIDRQVFSILSVSMQRDIGWSELEYGRIVIAFQISYALTYAVAGKVIDRIGTRLGYGLSMTWWSIVEMAHALTQTVFQFGVVRFVVGIGEGATFPAAIKGIAEWFPKRESGLATGILNSGPTVGAVVAPLIVPLVALHFGWRGAFVLTGALGFGWLAGWLILYRQPEAVKRASRPAVAFDASGKGTSWVRLLACRQTWAYAAGKVFADPAWFFYLYWLPKFLAQDHGIYGTAITPFLTTVYVMTGIGSVTGGYISSFLIRRGWTVNRSRKTTMGASAIIMPVVIVAATVHNTWVSVLLIGLALAAHQSWSSMVFTLGTDLFPRQAVGVATGIAGALGSFATIFFAETTGRVLQHDPKAYLPMFVACGLMYMVALAMIHLLAPRLQPITLD